MRQQLQLAGYLRHKYAPGSEFHHGDCVGSDAQAHKVALRIGYLVVIHPPSDASKRAWCKGPLGKVLLKPPKPYLERNHDIVDETVVLVGAPRSDEEELRSGTWSTIRYARKAPKPIFMLRR